MRYKGLSVLPLLLFGLAITEMQGQVQTPFEVKNSRISGVEYYASNYGIFGLNVKDGQSGFICPRGSNNQYLFGSGIWFGARKQVPRDTTVQEQKLSFIAYNPNSGTSWATPGEYNLASGATPVLYRSSDYDYSTGISLNDSASQPRWPLWLLPSEWTDPFFGGNFVPLNAERATGGRYAQPAFMTGVDEQFFSRYHDQDLSRYEIGVERAGELGYPLGLQIQEHIYSWKPGNAMQNVVILQYEITNVSNDVLRDCHIAQAIDFDIGLLENDRMGFYDTQPGLHTGIAWTETEAQTHGLLAMVMLEGPVTNEEGFIDNNRRGLFSSSGQVGVFRNWTEDNDPHTPEERYNFMAESVLDGDNGPGDKRALMGSKAFHMAPGDKAYFAFAFSVLDGITVSGTTIGEPTIQGTRIPELEELVTELHTRYYVTGFNAMVSSANGGNTGEGSELSAALSPNPGNEATTLGVTLAERSQVQVRIIDNLGRIVHTQQMSGVTAGHSFHRLDLRGIAAGSYLISIEAGTEQQSIRFNVVR